MNILILRFSALGDLITLEPTFRAIRYFFPDAEIHFVTSSLGKGLYEDTSYFNKIVVHKNMLNTLQCVRQSSYDLVYNLHCNSLSHFIISIVRYKHLINISATWLQKIIGIKIPAKLLPTLLEESNLNKKSIVDYMHNEESLLIRLSYSKDHPLSKIFDKKTIVFSTGSSEKWSSKRWEIEKFILLIKKLKTPYLDIALVGTDIEKDDALLIEHTIPDIKNFVGKTTLGELKILLANAMLYVGNDSGPSHMAAALGTNTVTIFASTGIHHCVKFGKYQGSHYCIKPKEDITCHPCYKPKCPTNKECTKSISVDEVYTVIQRIINE